MNITPNLKIKLIMIVGLLIFSHCAMSFQTKNDINLSDIYRQIIQTKKEHLTFSNIRVNDDLDLLPYEANSPEYLNKLEAILKLDIPLDGNGIISEVKTLSFKNVQGSHLMLQSLHLNELDINNMSLDNLSIKKVKTKHFIMDSVEVRDEYRLDSVDIGQYEEMRNSFHSYHIFGSIFNRHFMTTQSEISELFWIFNSRFKSGAYIGPYYVGNFNGFTMENNVFEPLRSNVPVELEEFDFEPRIFKTQLYLNLFGKLYQMNMAENQFLNDGSEQYIFIEGEFDYMGIEGNLFQSHFYPQTAVNRQLALSDNDFERKVIFSELILDGRNNVINWADLEGNKMAVGQIIDYTLVDDVSARDIPQELSDSLFAQTQNMVITLYEGTKSEDYEDRELFQSLISSYYRLYTNIKENGQILNADSVYVEMKDVQLEQFDYLYNEYGSIDNWIQWRLNQLLKIYTDHGTNPTKAIRISIWVVCLFSIFYFFFPSEWDTKSKGQLIDDYKIFVKKNDHGYFKPFLKLGFGFLKSLVNAFTLSLNSFVTLGFGTIPTSGLARYICILQGFLGWFLLSIFTASLINQVLF